MNPQIKSLLEAVNNIYPGTVTTRVAGNQTGELHIDRVSMKYSKIDY